MDRPPTSRWESNSTHLTEDTESMIYAVVHYPDIDTVRIGQLRKEYDPQAGLIEPHLTIVFPLPDSVGEQALVSHIERVLSGWHPFPIRLKGLMQSPDNYLLLLLAEGSADITRLHDELYTEVLAPYLRADIAFVPHVTLGTFGEAADGCRRALSEAERLNLDYESVVDRLDLLKINDDRPRIVWSKEFHLCQ